MSLEFYFIYQGNDQKSFSLCMSHLKKADNMPMFVSDTTAVRLHHIVVLSCPCYHSGKAPGYIVAIAFLAF